MLLCMLILQVSVFYGGVPIRNDIEKLKKSVPQLIVATPGRLLDLVRQKALSLKSVKHFILDECDKMLDNVCKWI